LNGDGKMDIVAVYTNTNSVATFLGNGDGTFQAPTSAYAGKGPYALTIADFTGDGVPDVVTTTGGSTAGGASLVLLAGNGNGTLGTPTVLWIGRDADWS